jgi:hypothetical protein
MAIINRTLSSNIAGFIFDIESGYVVSVPKIVIMIHAINNHDGQFKAAPPYVCGFSGVIQGLYFHPGHCDSTGATISEPYWELSSYDNTAFHTGIGHYSDQLAHPKNFPADSVAGLHHSNANRPFTFVGSQLLGYDGDNQQQKVGHFFVAYV